MHKLVPYFERELGIIRRNLQDLARRYPEMAAKLGLTGEQCADPAVERITHGTALLAAQISRKLDYYNTQWTTDLLAIHGAFYLNPVPSCSVVQVEANEPGAIASFPRGTALSTKAPACRFRTAYDVAILPITISVHYTTRGEAPLSLDLPPNAGGEITITIESKDPTLALEQIVTSTVRVYIDIDAATRAALYDGLLARTLCTCVESETQWRKLPALPFVPAGFSKNEALLPTPRQQDDSLRLLTEYLAVPEKFEFFDIDLKPVLAQCPSGARRLVLHMVLPDLHHTSTPQLLRAIPATALRLGCTPIVNMFARIADPIRLKNGRNTYPLTFPRSKEAKSTVYSIDAMHLLLAGQKDDAAIDMAWSHGQSAVLENYCWLSKLADTTAGTEDTVSFIDARHRPLELPGATVKAQVTCTNGDLPAALSMGRAGGDMASDGIPASFPIRLLRAPTAPLMLAEEPDSHLKLIHVISDGGRWLVQHNLPALLELLRMHARPDCAITQQQLAGIVGLTRREVTGWLPNEYGASLVYGYEFRLTIDPSAFAYRSIYAFAQVMDYLFGYYIRWGHFSRLILQSSDGQELLRCAQRPGTQSPA
jgi:type VI secretion system protein ImpG